MSGRTWSTEAAAGSDDGNDDGNPPRQEGNNDADRAEENIAPAPNQTNNSRRYIRRRRRLRATHVAVYVLGSGTQFDGQSVPGGRQLSEDEVTLAATSHPNTDHDPVFVVTEWVETDQSAETLIENSNANVSASPSPATLEPDVVQDMQYQGGQFTGSHPVNEYPADLELDDEADAR